jgi:hypothetical protein
MSFPTLSTCTKCEKHATLKRGDGLGLKKIVGGKTTGLLRLGYVYSVACPHCGFRFTTKISHPN